ncbi:MAG: hypothetical protein QXW94_02925 [Desulfurococcaceae archaeon]
MDRSSLYLISLASAVSLATSFLAALGEARLDVYVSVFTLIYLAFKALFRPATRTVDFLGAALVASFSIIVALRIMEALAGR